VSEKQVIRIIHILTGLLVFMIAVVVICCLVYFGMIEWKGTRPNDQAQEQSTDAATDHDSTEEQIEEISSKGKLISVYNSTKISGLAGRWSDKLRNDGYRIQVINNYDELLEEGLIIVKEKGMGLDLQKKYFPNAAVKVGKPDDEVDIQIILGKSEDDKK